MRGSYITVLRTTKMLLYVIVIRNLNSFQILLLVRTVMYNFCVAIYGVEILTSNILSVPDHVFWTMGWKNT